MNEAERSAGCLCGAVRMTVKTTNDGVAACHCSMCRKWGGGPLLAIEGASEVRLEGGDDITVYASSPWAERAFCRRCGTHLFYRLKEPIRYSVPVGLFDGGESWQFDQQIFIDEKPAYYTFADETRNMTGAEVFAQNAPSPK